MHFSVLSLCPNSLKKLAKCGVTSVGSNQRKWLVEQCFQMLCTTTVQNFRSFALETACTFQFQVCALILFKTRHDFVYIFLIMANQNKLTSFSHVSLVNHGRLPRKTWPISGFPLCCLWFQSELESPLFLTASCFSLIVLSTISCNVKVSILAIWKPEDLSSLTSGKFFFLHLIVFSEMFMS